MNTAVKTLTLFVAYLVLVSEAHSKKDVEFEGRMNVEVLAEEAFRVGDSDQEGVFKVKTKRFEGTRAILEMRGSTNSQNVMFREALINHKIEGSDNKVRIGRDKKRFGLEFETSMKDRIALIRGPIYRKFESFAFVGRDLSLSYWWGDDGDFSKSFYRAAYHSTDGVAHGGIFHWRAPGTEDFYYSQWTLLQVSENGDKLEGAFAHISALWWESGKWRGAFEVTGGKDPVETVFQKNLGNHIDIYFLGVKAEASVRLGQWEPMFQSNFIMHDTSQPSFQTFQALSGFRYWFSKAFRVGVNIEYITSASASGNFRFFEITDTQTNGVLSGRFFF